MAQATTHTTPAAPAMYGSAFCEAVTTARNLTQDEVSALMSAWQQQDVDVYQAAARSLAAALDRIGLDIASVLGTLPTPTVNTITAVLARDRGLISDREYLTLTRAWLDAGLTLPAICGGYDRVPVATMTVDRICHQLMYAARGTRLDGATIALTCYNVGELLAYPAVRRYLEQHPDGSLGVRWTDLANDVSDSERREQVFDQMSSGAIDALIFATSLAAKPNQVRVIVVPQSLAADDETAETATIAFAHAMGTEHLFGQPAATPAPLASEPGS